MGKIIVIGENSQQDRFTLALMAQWLEERGQCSLAQRLFAREVDVYDIATRPEKGDALDAITADTELVVALHLYGIDKLPGSRALPGLVYYNRNNGELLFRCTQLRIPVLVFGDQPWFGVEKKKKVLVDGGPDLNIWYYESYFSKIPGRKAVAV